MADRYPLVVVSGVLQEIPSGDNINLTGAGLTNAVSVATTTLTVADVDISPITGVTTYYVTTAGNDRTGDGSSANPWATPHKAIQFLRNKKISLSGSYGKVTVDVGVGTYRFGLNQTAAGTDYENKTYLLSGGSGTGAVVAITTTTSGAVVQAKLLDGGTGYLASDTLGITTTIGSGAQFGIFHVGDSGEILGELRVDHPDGDAILVTGGAVTGTKPGLRGNHFYNQCGVGIGSDPTGTGTSFEWSSLYDSTSPAGAYPNPMVDGVGNSETSEVYNRGILEAYYGSRLYFHGCNGFTSNGVPAKLDKLLAVGFRADGKMLNSAGAATTIVTAYYGVANRVESDASIDDDATVEENNLTSDSYSTQGSFNFGPDISIHGFYRSVIMDGGIFDGPKTTVTNANYIGVAGNAGSHIKITRGRILNCRSNLINASTARVSAQSCFINNSAGNGVAGSYNGFVSLQSTDDATLVSYGSSTVVANNRSHGVVMRYGATARVVPPIGYGDIYVYGNGNSADRAQLEAANMASIQVTNPEKVIVATSSGAGATTSPGYGVTGNFNSIITSYTAGA